MPSSGFRSVSCVLINGKSWKRRGSVAVLSGTGINWNFLLKICIWELSPLRLEVKLREMKGLRSVTEDQVDLLAIEGVVGALSYSPPGGLFTREGDQGLTAALTTEVVQDENGVWLELGVSP